MVPAFACHAVWAKIVPSASIWMRSSRDGFEMQYWTVTSLSIALYQEVTTGQDALPLHRAILPWK